MKIRVKTEVSQTRDITDIDFEDLGLTEEEWNSLNNDEKTEKLQDFVDESPNQPYWIVETFEEKL